jgi:glycosyltransferase involved in cell wall biosynthesis
LIRSGIDGILVPPSDVTALANSIESLAANPNLRRQLAQAGRQRVIEKYNLEKNTAGLGEIFERRLWQMGNQTSSSLPTRGFSASDQEIPYKQA